MGRFNASNKQNHNSIKQNLINIINNNENSDGESKQNIDWSQLLSPYQSQNNQLILENIINKINVCVNIEFDQICLVLQHYLLENDFLQLFINEKCIDKLLDRFFRNPVWNTNVEWMLSEVFKLLSSLCKQEQVDNLLTEKFNVLFQNLFNIMTDNVNCFNQNQLSVFKNVIDTAINICEIKPEVCKMIPIKWIHEFILETIDKPYLCSSLANLIFTISIKDPQYLSLSISLYPNTLERFLSTTILNENSNNLSFICLIGSLINSLLVEKNVNLSEVLNILTTYGHVLSNALNNELNDKEFNQSVAEDAEDSNNNESDNQIQKDIIRKIEASIESKLISLELLQSVFSLFLNEENEEGGEWEDLNDDNDENCNSEDMDVEMDDNGEVNDEIKENVMDASVLSNVIKECNFIDSIFNTILMDTDSMFEKNDKIEHLEKSIKLVKTEACLTYILVIKLNLDDKAFSMDFKKCHLAKLFNKISTMKLNNENVLNKIGILCNELFKACETSLNIDEKLILVNFITQYFEKNFIVNETFTINLSRILMQISISERIKLNLTVESKNLIKRSATILITLIQLCILKIETKNIYLFAELLDCLIDIFSEDNTKDIEVEVKLIEKMKEFNEKFHVMMKSTSYKLNKDKKVTVKTVADNIIPFIEYKLKH